MIDLSNKKVAILFAGQGAQYIGMGKDIYNEYEYVRDLYSTANDILGYDLSKICFEENNLLNQTMYTQPAMLVTSCALYEVFKRNAEFTPSVMAGFSLGEYSALYNSGIFDFKTIVELINKRAMFMENASQLNKGSMAAIIGMDSSKLEQVCEEIGNVSIANYNCPNQLVISGLEDSITLACDKAKENGARRAVKLNVSGAFHSKFMNSAAEAMFEEVQKTKYKVPNTEIIMNCNAKALEIDKLPELMKKQIKSSVYFEDTIRLMIDKYHIDTFVEIGPGNVLSGFVKKIDPNKEIITINSLSDIIVK